MGLPTNTQSIDSPEQLNGAIELAFVKFDARMVELGERIASLAARAELDASVNRWQQLSEKVGKLSSERFARVRELGELQVKLCEVRDGSKRRISSIIASIEVTRQSISRLDMDCYMAWSSLRRNGESTIDEKLIVDGLQKLGQTVEEEEKSLQTAFALYELGVYDLVLCDVHRLFGGDEQIAADDILIDVCNLFDEMQGSKGRSQVAELYGDLSVMEVDEMLVDMCKLFDETSGCQFQTSATDMDVEQSADDEVEFGGVGGLFVFDRGKLVKLSGVREESVLNRIVVVMKQCGEEQFGASKFVATTRLGNWIVRI